MRPTAAALLLCATVAGVHGLPAIAGERAARAPRPGRPVGDPLRPGVWRLHGTDPAQPTSDLAPLKQLIGRATVVGLGESIHTSGGFYQAKDRVIRYLVSELGFRVVALETPWVGADQVEAYVQSCAGAPAAAMSRIFGVWQSTETRDMVTWMCDWNRAHPRAQDQVHFMGFDIQDVYGQMPADAAALRDFLARVGIDADDPRSADLDQCDGVVRSDRAIPPERYTVCRAALNALDELFTRRAAELGALTSKADLAWAKLRLNDIAAWEDEIFYSDDIHLSSTARDRGMAYTLVNLRALRFPKAKTVVWAHNSHLSKANTIVILRGGQTMGSFLVQALGKDYLAVALASHQNEPAGLEPLPVIFPAASEPRLARASDARSPVACSLQRTSIY